jgi:hypothetical protein
MVSQKVAVMKLKLKLKFPFADLKYFTVVNEVKAFADLMRCT